MNNVNNRKTQNATPVEQRNYLLTAITWQESLLQSYRSIHATIQGLLIAAGVAVFAVQLTNIYQLSLAEVSKLIPIVIYNFIFSTTLCFLFWIQYKAAAELGKVIRSRASDVDFWHKELVILENQFPSDQRTLSTFKIWQQAKRSNTEHLFVDKYKGNAIGSDQIDKIIEKGLEHTRHVLDENLFGRLQKLWTAILFASLSISFWCGVKCIKQYLV